MSNIKQEILNPRGLYIKSPMSFYDIIRVLGYDQGTYEIEDDILRGLQERVKSEEIRIGEMPIFYDELHNCDVGDTSSITIQTYKAEPITVYKKDVNEPWYDGVQCMFPKAQILELFNSIYNIESIS